MFPGGYYPPQTLQEGCGNYNWGGYAYPIMPSSSPSCCTAHGYAAPAYSHIYPPPSSSPSPPPSLPYHHHIVPSAPAPYFYHLPYYFQQPAWTPMPLPFTPANCCCACSNHHHHQQPLHQDKLITPNNNNHKPVPKQYEQNPLPVDVTTIPTNGSTSTPTLNSPPLVWYYNSPQPHNLQHQADPGLLLKHNQQGPQHSSPPAHISPYHPDKPDNSINKSLATGFNNNGTRNYFTNFPLPVILMPYNGDTSDNKNMSGQSEEKSSSGDIKTLPEEHVDDETWQPLPVKSLEPENNAVIPKVKPLTDNGKFRVKYIPVKQEGEIVAKPSTSADDVIKSLRSRSVSPTPTIRNPKLPPVCLRVDPLPRKRAGNGASSPPAHKRNLQLSSEDSNAKNNEGCFEKTAKNMKVPNPSFINENLNDNRVCEDGKPGERRQPNEVGAVESVKMQSAQSGSTIGCMEKDGSKTKNKISEKEAAVRIQSAYRGYEERRWQSLQKLREIAQVREQISSIKDRIHALENDPDMHKDYDRQRLMIGETIMSLLLKLDTIQGLHSSIRDVRKSVAKELISLQEKLDSFHSHRSSKNAEIRVDDCRGDAEDINPVEQILCEHLTENEHSVKHEDRVMEKVTELDAKAEDKEEKLKKTVDSVSAEQHQALRVEDAAPTEQNQDVCKFQPMDAVKDSNTLLPIYDHQVVEENESSLHKHINAMAMMKQEAIIYDSSGNYLFQSQTDSCRKADKALNTGDKDESKVKDTADDTKDNGKDTEVIPFAIGEPSSEALDGSVDVVPKNETMENHDTDNDQPTLSVEQITAKGEELNSLSSSTVTPVEEGEISEQVSELGQEAPNVNGESVEVCATTLEHGPIDMKEQSEPEEMRSTSSPEEEIIAISSSCASPTVPQIH